MADARSLPSEDRHVHMSHVKRHLLHAQRAAALIHGREVPLHPDSTGPPVRSLSPSSPRTDPSGGSDASS